LETETPDTSFDSRIEEKPMKICFTAVLTECLGAFGNLTALARFGSTVYGDGALHNSTGALNTALLSGRPDSAPITE
jgi:hypothetical protein